MASTQTADRPPTTRDTSRDASRDRSDDARQSRAADRREHDSRDTADKVQAMRLRAILGIDQTLPDPPKLPGFHTIWLSTDNRFDTIASRIRAGYEPVKVDELPEGHDYSSETGGKFAGVVSCAEMILCKIPLDLYRAIMEHVHHKRPLEEEQGIRRQVEQITRGASEANEGRGRSELFNGMDGLGRARRPRFDITH